MFTGGKESQRKIWTKIFETEQLVRTYSEIAWVLCLKLFHEPAFVSAV